MAKLFVVTACFWNILVLSCAANDFIVELNPRTVNVTEGDNVTLECSYNRPIALIPMWEIDGMEYRVTDLPLGYESDGANITFRAVNSTIIRCFFNAFDVSKGDFEEIYSNNATVTTNPSPDPIPDFFDGAEKCRPENITKLVVDNEIYVSWDIKYFNTMGCSFLLTVWNCSVPDTPFLTCKLHAPHQHVRRRSLNQCLGRGYSYHHGTVVDIKWDNDECVEGDNGCSYDIYTPKLTDTVVIQRDMDGLFANLTNSYCNTNLNLSTSLLLCFESTPSQEYDGCYDDGGNEHFYLRPHEDNTWLGVKGINPSLNGTVISVFCILTDGPDNCPQMSPIETNIFNYLLAINVCDDNCSPNATCEDGRCMCKEGFTGDGMECDPIAMCGKTICSQNAICKDGQCLCKDGYKEDGLQCKKDESENENVGLIVGVSLGTSLLLLLLLLIIIVVIITCGRMQHRKNGTASKGSDKAPITGNDLTTY